MSKDIAEFDDLRRRAETMREKTAIDVTGLSLKDTRRLAHELQVHQIELELQNEDLRRTQEELVETRDRYTDLYDFAPVGYMTIDSKGMIKEANLKLCDMLLVERSLIKGRSIIEFIYADDQDVYYKHLREALGSALGAMCQLRMKKKDGDVFWLEMSSLSVGQKNEDIGNVRTVVTDITEKKERIQVAQADRMASLGLLSAGIAHEINNPLTYVLLNIDRLARQLPQWIDRLSDRFSSEKELFEMRELATIAQHAAEGARRVRDIAQRLKVFSHLESEQLLPLSTNEVIDSAIDIVRNECKYRARIFKSYGDLPEILGNSGTLCQLFLNILVNAAHAIEEGDVENNEIRVCTKQVDENILVEISDTGGGVPAGDLNKIFDPFYTTKEIGSGSGLGLSICKKIVKKHGGQISLESTLGRGSCFKIQLPIGKPPSLQKNGPETRKSKSREPWVRGRILVVDDESQVLEAMSEMLAEHEVHTAISGQAARELIEHQGPFDVILCDLMMPGYTGMDLYNWVMETHPDLAPRVVFMTGGAFTPRARELLQNTPNFQLEKPFRLIEVQLIVQNLILKEKREIVFSDETT